MRGRTGVDTSLYIIKPDGMPYQDEIRSLIGEKLVLGERKVLVLPPWAVHELYGNAAADVLHAKRTVFSNQLVEFGLVHGENAMATLVEVAGDRRTM